MSLKTSHLRKYQGLSFWPKHPCCCLVASESFLKTNKKEAAAFVRAHIAATKWIVANPEEAIKMGAEFTGMNTRIVADALKRIVFEVKPNKKATKQYAGFLNEMG